MTPPGSPQGGVGAAQPERSAPSPKPRPLSHLLRRGHGRLALMALAVGGLIATLVALAVLRTEVRRSLDLVARSVAYSIEAAALFEDADEAQRQLAALAEHEHLSRIQVLLSDGRVLAEASHRHDGPVAEWIAERLVPLFDLSARAEVRPNETVRAEVRLQGDGDGLLRLLQWAVIGIGAAMVAGALAVLLFSRRIESELAQPLDGLAHFTRSVRERRAYDRRAPRAAIAEIDALAEDFDALLSEVQSHQAELMAHQARLRLRAEALRVQAEHDALTGLPNRAAFHQRLQQTIERADATALGVMFVDADRFKDVNDRHGHAAGDRVLQEIGRRLQAALRESDLVARLGGDEFAILLDPLPDPAHAEVVARKIEQAMEAAVVLADGRHLVPRVSIGLALYPVDADDADSLLALADRAMYLRKRARRHEGLAAG